MRSPVTSSTSRSLTRGAVTSTGPAPVTTVRVRWRPLRTTRRRPCSSDSAANSAMYWLTSDSRAATGIRRAPSRTISSIREPDRVEPSSVTTLSTGVPSRPALPTWTCSETIRGSLGKVALRVPAGTDPQVSCIALAAPPFQPGRNRQQSPDELPFGLRYDRAVARSAGWAVRRVAETVREAVTRLRSLVGLHTRERERLRMASRRVV